MPTVWMDSSLGGMVVPLRPGHLVPGSLCRGQHPPPRLPQQGQGWCRGMHGVLAPRPPQKAPPSLKAASSVQREGVGFPTGSQVTRVLPLEIKKTENQFMALRIWKKTKEERKKKKKNLRRRKKCKEMSSVEPAAGGGRGRTGRGRG